MNELTQKEIIELKKLLIVLNSLNIPIKEYLSSHNHDNNNSSKLNNKNIIYDIIEPLFYKKKLADDEELEIQETYGVGIVMAGKVDEAALFSFSTDGSVKLLANTTNVDDADTDGCLCIYDGGTKTKIKNRLGATKEIRYIIFS